MADNDKAVLIGYVLIDQLQDNGTKGIVESGKSVRTSIMGPLRMRQKTDAL